MLTSQIMSRAEIFLALKFILQYVYNTKKNHGVQINYDIYMHSKKPEHVV